MGNHLQGQVVIVTGAFGSLGLAVAQAAAENGAQVVMIDRAISPVESLPESLCSALQLGGVDLTSNASTQTAVAQVEARFGRIDALVNVAGGFRWETLADGELESWDFLYNINLRTAVTASKAVIPILLRGERGRIVNIGAGAALKAGFGMGAYAASKAGVARLTESLAEELKDKHVTVNAVLPSIIDTAQNRADMPDAEHDRWVTPQALAAVILFLLSDDAGAITGASIPVSGRL